ncbi:MAG: hypothetical protein AAGB35_02800 [Pseudomonadota bacterium]
MPYFIFHLEKGTNGVVRDAELLDQFDDYKQAKQYARDKRNELNVKEAADIKIMFEENQDLAMQKVMKNRDAPILREWEK